MEGEVDLLNMLARAKEIGTYYGSAKSKTNLLGQMASLSAKLYQPEEFQHPKEVVRSVAMVFVAIMQFVESTGRGEDFQKELVLRINGLEERVKEDLEKAKVRDEIMNTKRF